MTSYPLGCGEPEPVQIREGGRWSDIMAAPLDDGHDDPDQPLAVREESPCTCMWCWQRRAES